MITSEQWTLKLRGPDTCFVASSVCSFDFNWMLFAAGLVTVLEIFPTSRFDNCITFNLLTLYIWILIPSCLGHFKRKLVL